MDTPTGKSNEFADIMEKKKDKHCLLGRDQVK